MDWHPDIDAASAGCAAQKPQPRCQSLHPPLPNAGSQGSATVICTEVGAGTGLLSSHSWGEAPLVSF